MAQLILWNTVAATHAPIRSFGCYQLASWLRHHGYDVQVIDFCSLMDARDLARVTERHVDEKTLAVGVSTTFWVPIEHLQYDGVPRWASEAREHVESKCPNLKWLLGGSRSRQIVSQKDWIRFDGFAEDTLLKFLDESSEARAARPQFKITHSISGFSRFDFIQPHEVLPIELARGCQFRCKFCSSPLIGKKPGTYLRSLLRVRDEFLANYEQFGVTKYYVIDDTANESYEKIKELAFIAQSLPFELNWFGYNRLDLIGAKPETIQVLKDSGLKSAYFGIESFHPKASLVVGKGWNGRYAKDFLIRLKKEWGNQVNWFLSLMVGLPGETESAVWETEKWCVENDMYEWWFIPLNLQNRPGDDGKSEFERNYAKYGFSFPDPQRQRFWVNSDWTYDWAVSVAGQMNHRRDRHCRPAGWLLAELMSLGLRYEELAGSRKAELPWSTFYQKTKEFVAKYVDAHLSISSS